jgi:hypothetical protein
MRQIKKWITLLPLVLLVLAGGCSMFDGINPFADQKPLDPKKFRFADLPVPRGLSLSDSDSFIFETPGTRTGTLVYTGFKNYNDTVTFYRERMPEHGWKLINSIERGEAALTFEKPGWTVTVFVRSAMLRTRVTINLGPRGKYIVEEDIPRRK